MNSLSLTLDAGAGCCLPIAYQQLTQGALYAAWRGSYPQLHDEGFAGDAAVDEAVPEDGAIGSADASAEEPAAEGVG